MSAPSSSEFSGDGEPPSPSAKQSSASGSGKTTGPNSNKTGGDSDSDEQHEAMINELMRHAGDEIFGHGREEGGGVEEEGDGEDMYYDENHEDEDYDDDHGFFQNQQDQRSVHDSTAQSVAGAEGGDPSGATVASRKRKLLKKAPSAPKRFKSAYICFVTEKMDSVKKSLPPETKVSILRLIS